VVEGIGAARIDWEGLAAEVGRAESRVAFEVVVDGLLTMAVLGDVLLDRGEGVAIASCCMPVTVGQLIPAIKFRVRAK
jgi:hypothetical protein